VPSSSIINGCIINMSDTKTPKSAALGNTTTIIIIIIIIIIILLIIQSSSSLMLMAKQLRSLLTLLPPVTTAVLPSNLHLVGDPIAGNAIPSEEKERSKSSGSQYGNFNCNSTTTNYHQGRLCKEKRGNSQMVH